MNKSLDAGMKVIRFRESSREFSGIGSNRPSDFNSTILESCLLVKGVTPKFATCLKSGL